MRIAINKHTCLVILAMLFLLEDHYGQSPNSLLSAEIINLEELENEPAYQWTIVPHIAGAFSIMAAIAGKKRASISITIYLKKGYYLAAVST